MPTAPDRSLPLDALRGLAATMVVLHHVRLPGLTQFTDGLDVGVSLFFALSGYLLYRPFVDAALAGRRVDLRGYFIRRISRIYPAFLVACVGIVILTGWTFYLADPIGLLTISRTPIAVAWTLAIELVFYALLPLFALVTRGFLLVERVRLILAVSVVSLALGAVHIETARTVPNDALTHLWAFAPGMLVAELAARRHPVLTRLAGGRWLLAGSTLIAISALLQLPYGDPLATVGSGLLIATLITRDEPVGWPARAAFAAGALSYSVYLWHVTIIELVDRPATWTGALAAFVLTAAIAAVSYVLVERPAIALGRSLSRAAGWRRIALRPVTDRG